MGHLEDMNRRIAAGEFGHPVDEQKLNAAWANIFDMEGMLRNSSWDAEPSLYWRTSQNGKASWQKARAAQMQPGIYAIEPPRPKAIQDEE